MKRALFHSIALILLVTYSASGQGFEFVSSTLWTGLNDVDVVGNYAYCALTNGLVILDVSNPAAPSVVSQTRCSGTANAIKVSGDYAYMCCGSLRIYNVAEPSQPLLWGGIDSISGSTIIFTGHYAYVGGGSTLHIVNITDPAIPFLVRSVPGMYSSYDNFIAGNHLYVADGQSGLKIYNISNPENPSLLVSYEDTPGLAHAVVVVGDFAYVADWQGGLVVINISSPINPFLVSSFYTPSLAMDVSILGNYAFVADREAGLYIIDISVPSNPTLAAIHETPASQDRITVADNRCYIIEREYDLRIVDVADPFSPALAGTYDLPGDILNSFIDENYAYVATDTGGLWIVNIAEPERPQVAGKVRLPGTVQDVFVSGYYAYVANIHWGLQTINVADPSNPVLAGTADIAGRAKDIFVQGDYAYMVNGSYGPGLRIFNISDPVTPQPVGYFATQYEAMGGQISGQFAYIIDGEGGFSFNRGTLYIVNIADPANLVLDGSHSWGGVPHGIAIDGSYAYVISNSFFHQGWYNHHELYVFNIADPDSILLAGELSLTGPAFDIEINGDYAYLDRGQLQVIDISDPTAPESDGFVELLGSSRDIKVSGDYMYVAGWNSFMIYHMGPATGVDEPDALPDVFALRQNYPNPFNVQTIISYSLDKQSVVSLLIYTISGQRVRALALGEAQKPGEHRYFWDGTDGAGKAVTTGIYFYELYVDGYKESKAMIMIK